MALESSMHGWRTATIDDSCPMPFIMLVATDLFTRDDSDVWLARFTGWDEDGFFRVWWTLFVGGKRIEYEQAAPFDDAAAWANEVIEK